MKESEFETVREIFGEAIARSANEQDAYIDAASDDPTIRQEVRSLLKCNIAKGDFLQTPPLGDVIGVDEVARWTSPDEALLGERIGQFRLTRVIASGGMGTVFEAQQDEPSRTVALKLMKRGLTSRSAIRRFEYESQILARLRHPGITQVLEAGTHDSAGGVPYFVMELIADSKTITDHARAQHLNVRDKLQLFVRICQAVHHGHLNGVIHRDLKPSNLLVDGDGEVKIIDFGVARATDSDIAITTIQTDIGQLIGTIQYMSPEQCAGVSDDIDIRSDVYSLGVVLYELLCEQLPYDVTKVPLHEGMRIVREQAPLKPSTFSRTLRGDLETITLKAMEKDRDRRYHSVADLGSDIQRYLSVEPIEARAPSVLYKFSKLARRHRAATVAVIAVFLALTGAVVISSLALSRESEQRRIAEFQRDEGDRQRRVAEAVSDFLRNDLLKAVSPGELGHDVTMLEVLDAASENLRDQFGDDSFVAATIHHTIALTYFDLGAFQRAEAHFVQASELFEQTAGPEAVITLNVRTDLAAVYENTSRFDEAQAVLVPVLETSRRVYGQHHVQTASALTQLGHVALSRGDYEKAEEYHRQALPVYQDLIGKRTPDTARALSNLAMSLRYQYRFEEAEPLYEEAVEILREKMGEDHPETLLIENNLGSFYFATKQYQRAVALFEPLVDKLKRIMPEDSPQILRVEANLAINLNRAGRSREAFKLYKSLLPRMQEVLGAGDYYTLAAASSLASLYRDLNMLDEAEILFDETIAQMNELWNEPHDFLMETKDGLAQVYVKQRRFAEAEPLYREILLHYGENLPPHHRVNMLYRLDLVRFCLLPLGNYQEAEDELLGLRDIAMEHLGPDHEGTISIHQNLVKLYDAWNKPDEATKWRDKIEDTRSSSPP